MISGLQQSKNPPRRLFYLAGLRMVVALLCMLAIFIYRFGAAKFMPSFNEAYAILVIACAVNVPYLAFMRRFKNVEAFSLVQIGIDVILESLLVYFTGGMDSIFAYLFFATVLLSAVLLSARASIFFASLSTVMLSAVHIAYFLAWNYRIKLPFLSEAIREYYLRRHEGDVSYLNFLLPYFLFFTLSLHIVALLSGRLSMELGRVRIFTTEILENMADGVIATDRNGKLAYVNSQVRRMLGLPADLRAAGQSIGEVLSEARFSAILAAMRSGSSGIVETTIVGRDGSEVPVSVATNVFAGEKGTPRGVIAILTDLTERRQMEDTLKRVERLQFLTQMGASIAHEIRNPLASIRGAVQELSELPALEPDDRKLMNIIAKESTRLDQIITNFLDYAREKQPMFAMCDIGAVLDEVVTLLRKQIGGSGPPVKLEVSGNLNCLADGQQLKQLFFNLGLNAVEAAKNGGSVSVKAYPSLPAREKTSRTPAVGVAGIDGVTIEFTDTGVGIPANVIDKVFDPFFSTKPKGTGLGLTIAGSIVTAHHGDIKMKSSEAAGTTMYMWIPRVQPQQTARPNTA